MRLYDWQYNGRPNITCTSWTIHCRSSSSYMHHTSWRLKWNSTWLVVFSRMFSMFVVPSSMTHNFPVESRFPNRFLWLVLIIACKWIQTVGFGWSNCPGQLIKCARLHEESTDWESKHTHLSCEYSRMFCRLYGEFQIAIVEKWELSQQFMQGGP